MFKARSSSSIACPSCGKRNDPREKFCVACASRLGQEPVIAPGQRPPPQRAANAAAATSPSDDSRFDAPRTVHSRSLPLQPPSSGALGFWFKFGVGGLVLLIGFIGWALYMTTHRSVVPTLPPAAVAPEAAPPEPVAAMPAAPTSPPSQSPPSPPAATEVTRRPPDTRRVALPAPQSAPARTQRQVASERSRPAVRNDDEVRAQSDTGAWVMPSRPPAVTSSPQFRDAGPPIVAGPRPGDAAASSSQASSGAGPDAGPPTAVGPGPLYDYSTPGATRRR